MHLHPAFSKQSHDSNKYKSFSRGYKWVVWDRCEKFSKHLNWLYEPFLGINKQEYQTFRVWGFTSIYPILEKQKKSHEQTQAKVFSQIDGSAEGQAFFNIHLRSIHVLSYSNLLHFSTSPNELNEPIKYAKNVPSAVLFSINIEFIVRTENSDEFWDPSGGWLQSTNKQISKFISIHLILRRRLASYFIGCTFCQQKNVCTRCLAGNFLDGEHSAVCT